MERQMFGFFNNDDKLSDACITNNIAIVAKLLKDGAEVNDPNRDGRTPLMEACQRNHFECVQLILTNREHPQLNLKDDDGNTGGIEKKAEPVKKENEPEKWLNKLNKDGSMTPEWSNMLKGIEMGTVKSIAHLRQFYKIAKKEALEIETLIPQAK